MNEKLLKLERRQKEICSRSNIPNFPVRAPPEFPPPPHVYNPWEDMSYQHHFGGYEYEHEAKDLGGREKDVQDDDEATTFEEGGGEDEGEDDENDEEDESE